MSTHALSHLPRTIAALDEVRQQGLPRVSLALRLLRRIWSLAERLSAPQSTCDDCHGVMLEHCPVDGRRICVRCVSSRRTPLSEPELAGAAAVVRTLMREAQLDWRSRQSHPFEDLRRNEAIIDTMQGVLWWMTPPNLRTPNVIALREEAIVELLRRFDRVWTLRCNPSSLTTVYTQWRNSQSKAARHADLAEIDRRYASVVRSVL
jgi:hypothetical protein